MKQTLESDIFDIKKLEKEQSDKILNILKDSNSYLTTYNQLMNIYEDIHGKRVSYIFVCQDDIQHTFIFQHLPLFARHYNIKLYKFSKGTQKVMEKICNKKFVNIISIFKDDPITVKIEKIFLL
ncbi:hypothetical protein CWI36_1616p0020 [Hamiltosporidium magnivora]|uniref:Ribosomal protein L7Ae/L30e/S12e/Gadd45 domain-containing protein n=1 Tax=Hamiltosporidium magnivora TaxID=148818 RepID=A0A4V2JUN8_9MICR|nr:hypothetical protein CWI36_1616p0020 [Hamiltosporidium magnivora]